MVFFPELGFIDLELNVAPTSPENYWVNFQVVYLGNVAYIFVMCCIFAQKLISFFVPTIWTLFCENTDQVLGLLSDVHLLSVLLLNWPSFEHLHCCLFDCLS